MSTFFVYSDESGEYKKDRTDRFVQSYPYYCRASIISDSKDWKRLRNGLCDLKSKLLRINPYKEVKWSYLWSLYKYRKNQKEIPKDKPFYFLRERSQNLLVKYVASALELMSQCERFKVIYTITLNNKECTSNVSEVEILKMHMQDMMQRVQMEVQSEDKNLCVIYFDSKGRKLDEKLKEAYHIIYQEGDFIKNYTHIVDSIILDFSHHNSGIQIADYCAGVFNGMLRGYPASASIFKDVIWDNIRRHKGKIYGCGICEVPTNPQNRKRLEDRIGNILKAE